MSPDERDMEEREPVARLLDLSAKDHDKAKDGVNDAKNCKG